jgi:hypothetical protein
MNNYHSNLLRNTHKPNTLGTQNVILLDLGPLPPAIKKKWVGLKDEEKPSLYFSWELISCIAVFE